MRLNKSQREMVRVRFDGRCAYCGEPLGTRWHADHFVPVVREFKFVSGGGTRATGKLMRAENDRPENMMPACAPCNIDKHSMPLEVWRAKLQRACEVLSRNNPTYRHAVRFGLVRETRAPVVFYFERVTASEAMVRSELVACEHCDRTWPAGDIDAALAAGWVCGVGGWLCGNHRDQSPQDGGDGAF